MYDALPGAVVNLLPTPCARDWKSGASNLHGKNSRPLNEVVLLFPTPVASDGTRGSLTYKRGNPTLRGAVLKLLPTPTAADGKGGPGVSPNRKGGMNLRTAVTTLPGLGEVQDWAEFEPAIRRQEYLSGREAPVPTELGPRGGRRLASRFAEWLMWLPDGHVTAVPGLNRSEQLQRIGNGAVPQQAYEAYRLLLAQHHA